MVTSKQTMTICSGFICKDGLLLTADTQISGGGKYDAAKICRLKFSGGEYVITGAGSVSFIGMASDRISAKLFENRRKFTGAIEKRKAVFLRIVQEEILDIHARHVASYPYGDPRPYFALILGVQFAGKSNDPDLLHCAVDGGVFWAQNDIIEGSGADIARRFANILCLVRLPLDVMRSVAIFCLHQAKEGAEGCGGAPIATFFRLPGTTPYGMKKRS